MTYFEDLGGIYDVPLQTLWKYLFSSHHGQSHAAHARNFNVKASAGNTGVVSAERFLQGKWATFVSRSTDYPPLCICNEELEGEFAGTKFLLLYRPDGMRTHVDVYGDVQSPVHPPDEAVRLFLETLQGAYEDDVAQVSKVRAQLG